MVNTNYSGKKVAVLGYGVDTDDAIPFLLGSGAKITIFDKKEYLATAYESEENVEFKLGCEDFGDLSGFDYILRNPAVYRYKPEIVLAESKGVEVTSKVKLFFDVCPAKIIGVTGTKGKGTTSSLIYEMLKADGKNVFLGGNIGTGIFGFLDELKAQDWVVLELSSFQLIDLHKSAHIGVILMVTTEHQDWHASIDEYVESKGTLIKFQNSKDFAIINDDYENSRILGKLGDGFKYKVSRDHEVASGCYVEGSRILLAEGGVKEELISIDQVKLKGAHNLENIMAAALASMRADVSTDSIKRVIRNFKGLEHRLEEVAEINGVTYFNDSFSTVPETAIAAIKAFKEPTILILGGSEKNSDFAELGRTVASAKHVKAVFLIGLMAPKIKQAIVNAGPSGSLSIIEGCTSLEEVVNKASKLAIPGDVVVLSPACASFDMFANYKDRGNQFKKQVLNLKG